MSSRNTKAASSAGAQWVREREESKVKGMDVNVYSSPKPGL